MLSCITLNFIIAIYINVTQLTYSLIGLLAMARRVIWITSVRPFVQKLSWNWLVSFFWNSAWCLGPMWCCVWQTQIFWKSCFALKMGGNRPSPGLFQCIRKSSFFYWFLIFFTNLAYNESLYYCNSCMLEQISYLGKFWFLRYDPKCSWPIRLLEFSINCRTCRLGCISQTNWWNKLVFGVSVQMLSEKWLIRLFWFLPQW